MTTTREQIIATTSSLIERQGYHATGLNEIVRASGAPKGSLYYYFPHGKEEITAAAIHWAADMVTEHVAINLQAHERPADAIRTFVHALADHVEQSGFSAGGPLQMVAMETASTSEPLNQVCRDAYQHLEAAFAAKLHTGGFSETTATRFATIITAAVEGAILLSRTYHSTDPLRLMADALGDLLTATPT
jgi:TetR/AcrR family transcriptional repressor of lmrAB and yxaGH operons